MSNGNAVQTAVVPMEREHIPEIARLESLCFSQPWSQQGLAAELTNPTARFLVALWGGKTAGYAGMHGVCGEGYVANIAVFPEYRKKGIGRKLVRALLETARGEAYDFLSLEVRPSNLPAVELYRSEGFRIVGMRRGFYDHPKEDGCIMTYFFRDEGESKR